MRRFVVDLTVFGLKELRCCVFAGAFFILLFASKYLPLGELPRYDFLFVAAVVIQVLMVVFRLETVQEALAISLFHLVGLGLELYKTSPLIGSWSYPEFCYLKLGTVPLYAGFMYAAVGSFMMQSWTVLKLRFVPFPHRWLGAAVSVLIYGNFFSNHWIPDLRWLLLGVVVAVYFRTWVYFTVTDREYRMPLLVAFALIAFFIWIAENMATFLGAWSYPDQTDRWNWVSASKISSWSMLVIISFLIVAVVRQKPRSTEF